MPSNFSFITMVTTTNMSRVGKFRDPRGRVVAVKMALHGTPSGQKRFQREIEMLQQAAGPSVMPVLEYDETDFLWYSMPWCAFTLNDYAQPTPQDLPVPLGTDPLDLTIEVLASIADGLRSTHDAGGSHRDLKPANILALGDQSHSTRWVIGDFGIARNTVGRTVAGLTETGTPLGTDGWWAPEQGANAHQATATADVYSAALIAAWLLRGSTPLAAGQPAVTALTPGAGALRRALSLDPLSRPSMDTFFSDFKSETVGSATPAVANLGSPNNFHAAPGAYRRDQRARDTIVKAVAALSPREVSTLATSDPSATATAITDLCALMTNTTEDLDYSDIDDSLIRMTQIAREISLNDPAIAASALAALLDATASIHQFAPAYQLLKWIMEDDSIATTSLQAIRADSHTDFYRRMFNRYRADAGWDQKSTFYQGLIS